MFKVSKSDIDQLRNYVVEELIENYNYSLIEAKKAVKNSSFYEMLQEKPQYVFHYDVEYWAEDVDNEYHKTNLYAIV